MLKTEPTAFTKGLPVRSRRHKMIQRFLARVTNYGDEKWPIRAWVWMC